MRTAILVSLVLVGMSAQASWFQEYCTSADGTTKMAQGHDENYIQLTERSYDQDWNKKEKIVRDENGTLNYSNVSEQELEKEFQSGCREGGGGTGLSSWRQVYYRKVQITKADNSMFSQDTVGVSSDLTTVTASMICENLGSSEVICEKN